MKTLYRKNGIVLLFILLLSFRATAQSDNNQIGIELYKLVSGNYDLYDLVYCYMVRGGNAGIDNNDLPKLNQFNENVAVQRNAQDFGIETRGLVNCTDTVQLRIYRMNVASYRFVIDMIQYPAAPGLTPVLQDIFLNTERPLKFGDTTRINFSVTSNAASTGLRFRIVFRRTQVQTAPFTQIPPICRGEAINLPTTSSNGINGTWTPAANNTQTTTYTFIPSEGQCATRPTMTVQVNQPALPSFTQVAAVCKGTSFTLPTTSNNGITGNWSPAINTNTTTTYTFTPAAGQCASTATMTVQVNEPTSPAFTQVSAVCKGTSFSLPTTSNNGISGNWSPAINTNTTTTYTFTPAAGQCASTATMMVQVNEPTSPAFTQVSAVCKGTSFSLPTTSNNGITGNWSPAINTNTTTIYTFTPTAGQCASTTTMTVEVNEPTSPAFTQVTAVCKGTSFSLPTTSNNDITGNWSPAINTNTTTTYTFTPTSGQCASTATMTVQVNEPTSPAFTQVSAVCKGTTFTLPATSNNGITGNWSPAINTNTTTTYTFTPTAGQCASTTTMTVQVNEPVTPVFNQIGPFNNGESFTLPSVSNNGISGNWSPAINNTTTTTYTFTPLAGECATVTQLTVVINTATSLYDVTFDRSVIIYPNPVSKNGTIQLLFKNQKAGKYELQFFAIDGTLVQKSMIIHTGGTSSRSINFNQNIGSGQYLVRIVNEMAEMATMKLMVK